MRALPFLVCLLFVACQTTVAVKPSEGEDGRVGFRDDHGAVRVSPEYVHVSEYTADGLAWVILGPEGVPFWIDRDGNRVAQAFLHDNGADPFVEGRARIVEDRRVGFIDAHGRKVVPPRFDYLGPLKNGRAPYCEGCTLVKDGEHSRYEGGRWGVIDADGVIVEPAR